MRLAVPRVDLPAWSPADVEAWIDLTARSGELVRAGGRGSQFGVRVREITRLIETGDLDTLDAHLRDRAWGRPLLAVWRDSSELSARSMTPQRLGRVTTAQEGAPTYLFALELVGLHLAHFDLVEAWSTGMFEALAEATAGAVAGRPPNAGTTSPIESFRTFADIFSVPDGPVNLARNLVGAGTSLDEFATASGLTAHMGGRFGQRARQAYYLQQIASADHRRTSYEWLADIVKPEVKEAPGADGLFFGHEILLAMTDKPVTPPSDAWLRAIVDIAGDPRIDYTPEWRTWWEPLPPRAAARVTQWIGAEDLELFLEAVEQYGREARKVDLLRMFPPRRKFLQGLYDLGLVRETRLILGRNVKESIRRQLSQKFVEAATFADRHDTAVVVIDCGEFFLVEGSHSFKLWVYLGDTDEKIMDRRERWFDHHDLTVSLPLRHSDAHTLGWSAHLEVWHRAKWQHNALTFLMEKHGIDIDVRAVLSDEDYRYMKLNYGIPVARPLRGRR